MEGQVRNALWKDDAGLQKDSAESATCGICEKGSSLDRLRDEEASNGPMSTHVCRRESLAFEWGVRAEWKSSQTQDVAMWSVHYQLVGLGNTVLRGRRIQKKIRSTCRRERNQFVFMHLEGSLMWLRDRKKDAMPNRGEYHYRELLFQEVEIRASEEARHVIGIPEKPHRTIGVELCSRCDECWAWSGFSRNMVIIGKFSGGI